MLLRSRSTKDPSSLSSWFCFHKCPGYWAAWGRNFIAQSWVINIKYSARLSSMIVRNRWKMYTSSPPNKDGKMVHFGFCAVSFMIWVGGGGEGGSSYNPMIFSLKTSMPGSADEISQNNRYRMWPNFLFLKSFVISSSYFQPANWHIYFPFRF